MQATQKNRLKDRGLGGANTGISSGQYTFATSKTADSINLMSSAEQRINTAVDNICQSVGEGIRPVLVGMLDPVRREGVEGIFAELNEYEGDHSDTWVRFTEAVAASRHLSYLGYENLEPFKDAALTPREAYAHSIAIEDFDAVNHYKLLSKDAGVTPLLHLLGDDDEVIENWDPLQYTNVEAANKGLKEAIKPGYTEQMGKLSELPNGGSYEWLVMGHDLSADQIIDYADALGADKADASKILDWKTKKVTADMLREYGQNVCRKHDSDDLDSGQVPAEILRSAGRSLPLFSYKDLAELDSRLNVTGIQPAILKGYGSLVHPGDEGEPSQTERLCALMNTGADPEDIRIVKQLSTSSDSQDDVLRVAGICAAGLNSRSALERYVGSAQNAYVSLKTRHTDYLTVAESALAAKFKASDVEAYVESGCDIGKLKDAKPGDDFWKLGAEDREEFASVYGRPWPTEEKGYRELHDSRPAEGHFLD